VNNVFLMMFDTGPLPVPMTLFDVAVRVGTSADIWFTSLLGFSTTFQLTPVQTRNGSQSRQTSAYLRPPAQVAVDLHSKVLRKNSA
jgi:hypothetical protein